jgi:hypothetical protein
MRARGALRQDAFALQLQRLPLPLPLRFVGRIRWNCGPLRLSGGCLLFFHGFALPALGHAEILRPPYPSVSFYLRTAVLHLLWCPSCRSRAVLHRTPPALSKQREAFPTRVTAVRKDAERTDQRLQPLAVRAQHIRRPALRAAISPQRSEYIPHGSLLLRAERCGSTGDHLAGSACCMERTTGRPQAFAMRERQKTGTAPTKQTQRPPWIRPTACTIHLFRSVLDFIYALPDFGSSLFCCPYRAGNARNPPPPVPIIEGEQPSATTKSEN